MKIKLSVLIAFALMVFEVQAQNVAEDIRRINAALLKTEQLSFEMTYNVFPDSSSKSPMQTENGKWLKKGSSQYHLLGNIETVRKMGELQLVIDHENKMAVVSAAPQVDGDGNMNSFMGIGSMEALLEQCQSIKYREINGMSVAYDLFPVASEFSKITVVFDRKLFLPLKFMLQYANPVTLVESEEGQTIIPRIEIDFKNTRNTNDVSKLTDINNYILRKGNSYVLVGPYKDYRLNNYLLTN